MRISDLYYSYWRRPGTLRSLSVGGLRRTCLVHIPQGRDPQTPMPLVLALHGATMNGPMMAAFSGLNRTADEAGFLIAYPNGTGKQSAFTWNGGDCCGSAMRNNVDDVAFINALLDDLQGAYRIDARRIYVTGMSNGAIMTYRLAAELSDRIAAIAPVSGALGVEIGELKRPVSVLHFHGTKDEFVPFQGGQGPKSITGTHFRSADQSIQAWVKANGCDVNPKIDLLSNDRDDMQAIRKTYGGGKDGAEVVLIEIEGGGHTWPGMKSFASVLGKSTMNISANDLMWEFFQRRPMQ